MGTNPEDYIRITEALPQDCDCTYHTGPCIVWWKRYLWSEVERLAAQNNALGVQVVMRQYMAESVRGLRAYIRWLKVNHPDVYRRELAEAMTRREAAGEKESE
jgi:hypothetical protein